MLVVAAVFAAQVASADMITQTVTWGPGEAPWSAPNNITQFDPVLGMLNSVQLDFSGYSWGTMSLEHRSANKVTLSSTLGAQIVLSDALQNPVLTILPATGFSDYFNGKTTVTHTIDQASAAFATTSAMYTSDLSRWIGSGNWVVIGASQDGSIVDSNQLIPTHNLFANATLTVIYNYDDVDVPQVPEPAAFLLIGSGLLGLGLLRRRRSA